MRKAISLAKDIFAEMMRGIKRVRKNQLLFAHLILLSLEDNQQFIEFVFFLIQANGKIFRRMLKSIKEECYDTNPSPNPPPDQ